MDAQYSCDSTESDGAYLPDKASSARPALSDDVVVLERAILAWFSVVRSHGPRLLAEESLGTMAGSLSECNATGLGFGLMTIALADCGCPPIIHLLVRQVFAMILDRLEKP